MATSDRIIEAATRQSSGEELSGADRQMAEMVNGPALPDLPQDVQEGWAQMPLEQRSAALGSLIDSRKGDSTSPEESAAESNTAPSEDTPPMTTEEQVNSPDSSPKVADEWGQTTPSQNSEADIYDGWTIPAYVKPEGDLQPKTKGENNLWAAIVRDAYSFNGIVPEAIAIEETQGTQASEKNLEQEVQSYEQAESQAFREMANKSLSDPNADPEELSDEMQALAEIEQARLERAGNTFTVMAEAMGAETPELAAKVAGDMALYKVVRDAADQTTGGDIFQDIASSFIPGDATKDRLKASGDLQPVKYFMNVKTNLEGLGTADRAKALAQLGERLREADLNNSQVTQILGALASPTTEDELEKIFPDSDVAMDFWDVVLTLTGVGAALAGTYRGVKIFRAMGKMEEAKDAAAIARLAEDVDRAAASAGTTPRGVQDNIEPFLTEWVNPESMDGVSAGSLNRIQKFEERIRAQGADMVRGTSLNKEGFLTDEQLRIATGNFQHKLSERPGVQDISIRKEGDNLEATYTVEDEFGNVTTETDTYKLSLEDASEIQFADPGTIKKNVAAKGVWATDDLKGFVEAAERLDSQDAGTLEKFRRMWKEALEPVMGKGFVSVFKGFSPKQRKRIEELDKVLLTGDKNKEVYTPDQLKSGVLGYKFDDQMIESYYHIRSIADWMHYARNGEKRRELDLQGFKNVDISDGSQAVVKPLSDAQHASQSVNLNKGKWYYDDVEGEGNTYELSAIDLEEEYRNGNVLVRLQEPRAFDGAEVEVKYSLVRADQVTELPQEVIPYRIGYVPKLNENVGHIVKRVTPRNVDGTTYSAMEEGGRFEAVRFFDNKKDADLFVEQEMRKLADSGVDPREVRYVRHEDRQLEKERRVDALSTSEGGFGGGLYTGARSEKEILHGIEGRPVDRVNSIEAISRALTATSRFVSRNEWRLGMEETFVRTANQLADNPNQFSSFRELAGVQPDTENNRKIKAMYDAGADWLNFPTSEELLFKNSIQGILDRSGVVTKMPGAKKGLMNLKSKDPVGAARAAAFHGMLGWFNPVQLWVQAQGASVALSMNITNPAAMGRVLNNQLGLQAMQHVELTDANYKHMAKAIGMSVEDFKEYKNAWDRTGLADSVLTTADHAAASVGYGSTLAGFKRVADKGLFFYRAGELFNRRLSFTTAFDEWKRANKGAALTDEGLRAITTRANNLMLNMSKANRANWQKGVLGLATQFQQINARTIESLLGFNGNFTWAERGKILAGQLGLYGAAGVPLATMGQKYIMEMRGIEDIADLEKEVGAETVKLYNEGFLGWATMAALGVDAEVGERSALLGGTRRFVDDILFTEGTVADKLLGAFGNTSSRFWGGLVGAYKPFSFAIAQNTPLEIPLTIASPVLSSISTFRNADKALFMHHTNSIVDKNWNPTIVRDFNIKEEITVGIGLQLKDEATIWQREKISNVQKSLEKSLVNTIVSLTNQYAAKAMLNGGKLSDEDSRQFQNDKALLVQGAGDPLAVARVIKGVQTKLENTKSKESQSWRTFREYTDNQLTSTFEKEFDKFLRVPAAYLQGEFGGGGIHRQGVFDDEQGEEE